MQKRRKDKQQEYRIQDTACAKGEYRRKSDTAVNSGGSHPHSGKQHRNEDATHIKECGTPLVPKVEAEDGMDSGSLVEETEHTDEEVEAVIKDTESAKQSQFTGESEISSNGFPDHTNCKAPQIK